LANPDSTADRTRAGFDLTYKYKSFLIEGEYLMGKDDGEEGDGETVNDVLERSGYAATLGYTIIKDKCQVIARLDNYDKDINKDLNIVNKYILAGSWYFSKTTRVQLEYNIVAEEDPDKPVDNNLFAIQFQAAF
ncbi:MAG: hypothetical protein H7Y00_14865, partial [Fimbriimonadaceae bacterium]|nr:hypothetical protein [Chitinophagales bacterium]